MKDQLKNNIDEYLPLRDVVFNTLRHAIITGEFAPGERLMEITLANRLGVSRTPVREAIRKLELEGLVTMIPRKGAQVAKITEKNLRDVIEIRCVLEEFAASLACERITDEEKDAMSEKEVEKWEEKIKDSLLRRDSTLSTVSSAMKEIMASSFTVGGKSMSLADFGIETLGYFNAADNEKNAYHINGDEDEETLKTKDNTLKEMITKDPNTVVDFFTQLSKSLYGKLDKLMARSDSSSLNSVYDDKKMKEDYDDYTSKIKTAEQKLTDYEDKWYKKFSAMETALAKMQSNASAITGLLGGS